MAFVRWVRTLDDLQDVNVTGADAPADGEWLTYDAADATWAPDTPGGG